MVEPPSSAALGSIAAAEALEVMAHLRAPRADFGYRGTHHNNRRPDEALLLQKHYPSLVAKIISSGGRGGGGSATDSNAKGFYTSAASALLNPKPSLPPRPAAQQLSRAQWNAAVDELVRREERTIRKENERIAAEAAAKDKAAKTRGERNGNPSDADASPISSPSQQQRRLVRPHTAGTVPSSLAMATAAATSSPSASSKGKLGESQQTPRPHPPPLVPRPPTVAVTEEWLRRNRPPPSASLVPPVPSESEFSGQQQQQYRRPKRVMSADVKRRIAELGAAYL